MGLNHLVGTFDFEHREPQVEARPIPCLELDIAERRDVRELGRGFPSAESEQHALTRGPSVVQRVLGSLPYSWTRVVLAHAAQCLANLVREMIRQAEDRSLSDNW